MKKLFPIPMRKEKRTEMVRISRFNPGSVLRMVSGSKSGRFLDSFLRLSCEISEISAIALWLNSELLSAQHHE